MEAVSKTVNKKEAVARCWWLMPVIIATFKAEIGRIMV
jgi:hypothetical protein